MRNIIKSFPFTKYNVEKAVIILLNYAIDSTQMTKVREGKQQRFAPLLSRITAVFVSSFASYADLGAEQEYGTSSRRSKKPAS